MLFPYIGDKDVFLKQHENLLAKRLIAYLQPHDLEKAVISKLKVNTTKIRIVFTNVCFPKMTLHTIHFSHVGLFGGFLCMGVHRKNATDDRRYRFQPITLSRISSEDDKFEGFYWVCSELRSLAFQSRSQFFASCSGASDGNTVFFQS